MRTEPEFIRWIPVVVPLAALWLVICVYLIYVLVL
jgi:hypothetical protein